MNSPWAKIVDLCDARLKKLRKNFEKAYDTDAQVAIGRVDFAKWNTLPRDRYDTNWTSHKKPKKGRVTTNDLIAPSSKMEAAKEATLFLSLHHKDPLLVMHPILFKSFKFKTEKPVSQMGAYELKMEQKSLQWALSSAQSMPTLPFKEIAKIKQRLQDIADNMALKSLTLDIVEDFLFNREWIYNNNGDVVYKALPKATPDHAPQGRAPAQSMVAGVNPNTGKKKYITTIAKTGRVRNSSKVRDEEKPLKHTLQSMALALDCKPEYLSALAKQMGERKFIASLRKKYGSKVATTGFTDIDIADVHRDITTSNAT